MNEWKRVVFTHEIIENDGICPLCNKDESECECPGPTMDEEETPGEYKEVDGILYWRPITSPNQP